MLFIYQSLDKSCWLYSLKQIKTSFHLHHKVTVQPPQRPPKSHHDLSCPSAINYPDSSFKCTLSFYLCLPAYAQCSFRQTPHSTAPGLLSLPLAPLSMLLRPHWPSSSSLSHAAPSALTFSCASFSSRTFPYSLYSLSKFPRILQNLA